MKFKGTRALTIWSAGALVAGGLMLGGCKGKEGGGEGGEGGSTTNATSETPKAAGKSLEIVDVVAHNGTGMALLSNGTVRAWGSNVYGQLGREDRVNGDSATPVEIGGLKDIKALYGGGSNLAFTACAVDGGGEVSCWGQGDLIPGHSKLTAKPVKVPSLKGAKKIAFGGGNACAVMPDDSLSCWGYNAFGSVGTGKADDKYIREATKLAGMTDIKDVSLGNNHGCALHKSGEVSCWGYNSSKQVSAAIEAREVYVPTKVEGIKGATALGVGYDVSCVATAEKKAQCWGDNFYKKNAEAVPGSEGVVSFASNFSEHTCMINDKAELLCWGDNKFGQAGVVPTDKKSKDLRGEPKKVEGLSGVTAVSTGYINPMTCAATKTDVYCFGSNRMGGLGNGTLVDSGKPVKVMSVAAEKLPEAKQGYDTVKAIGSATSFDALPKECKKPTTLKTKLKKIKGITEFPVVFAQAKVKERKRDDDKMGKYYEITMRSYTYDPTVSIFDVDQRPRGEQVEVGFSLSRYKAVTKKGKGGKETTKRTALDVDAGTYQFGKVLGEDRRELGAMSGSVRVRTHKAMFGGLFTAVPGAKVTYVGEDWVCGELEMRNKDNTETLSGAFAAPVLKKK